MTKVEALKRLFCAINGTGESYMVNMQEDTVTEVLKNFIFYYNGDLGEFVPLYVESEPGATSGKTLITVSVNDAENARLMYKVGSNLKMPAYHEVINVGVSATSWHYFSGNFEIEADDGVQICVALVDWNRQVTSAGITTVHSNTTGPL